MTSLRNIVWERVDPALYDAVRPQYPEELLAQCSDVLAITPSTRILEIGAGTGIATRPLLMQGSVIDALEPDRKFAAFLAQRTSSSRLSVHAVSLEQWIPSTPAHHVVAANSWHWLNADTARSALQNVVQPDGLLAVLEYHHCSGGNMDAFEAIHCPLNCKSPGRNTSIRSAQEIINDICAQWQHYHPVLPPTAVEVAIPYTAEAYCNLIATYPDILALPPMAYEHILATSRVVIEALPDHTIWKNYLFSLTIIEISAFLGTP